MKLIKDHAWRRVLKVNTVFILLLLCCYAIPSFAQQSQQGLLAQLNQKLIDIERVINDSQSLQVHILSPNDFAEAKRYYESAKSDLDRGRDVKSIQKNLDRAEEFLAKAIENAKEAKKQLPFLIQARDDALTANAPEYALELFEKAERDFKDAMSEIEDSDLNNAIKKAKDGESEFREAELTAIKASIIGNVHKLLDEARNVKAEKFAPQTYKRSTVLLQEAENILNTDRSAQATARVKAEQAEYQARRSIYISKLVQENRADDAKWEVTLVKNEQALNKVASQLNMQVKYDNGMAEAVNSVDLALKAVLDDKAQMRTELEEKNKELADKNTELRKLTAELDVSKQQEAGLKQTLEAKKRQEEKIKRIEDMFGPSEAIVLREGTSLVIRMVGLNFASGKSVIEPAYFGLLTKVQRAIREFPNAPIVIEGHTDSRGYEAANMQLSEKRADSVKSYLLANMGLPSSQIQSMGYGQSKPIASNETESGRQKNRRIDIVIEMGRGQ